MKASPRRLAAWTVAALAAGSGLTRLLRRRRRRRGDRRLYILEYHDVTNGSDEREGTISAERFRRHLRHLETHFRLETLSAAAEHLEEDRTLSEELAVLTFDDGYAGNYEAAWPVLQEAGAGATFFLTTGFLDGAEIWFDFARRAIEAGRRALLPPGIADRLREDLGSWPPTESTERTVERLKYFPPERRDRILALLREAEMPFSAPARPLSWNQAREMLSGGCELGAHTVTHPILSTLAPDEQELEIRRSRDRIGEETGVMPRAFAYPNGSARDFDRRTVEIVRRAGFSTACTTLRGANRAGCDRLTLKRIGIGSDPVFLLEARLAGFFDEEVRSWLRR